MRKAIFIAALIVQGMVSATLVQALDAQAERAITGKRLMSIALQK